MDQENTTIYLEYGELNHALVLVYKSTSKPLQVTGFSIPSHSSGSLSLSDMSVDKLNKLIPNNLNRLCIDNIYVRTISPMCIHCMFTPNSVTRRLYILVEYFIFYPCHENYFSVLSVLFAQKFVQFHDAHRHVLEIK